jgi:hypothetical protein
MTANDQPTSAPETPGPRLSFTNAEFCRFVREAREQRERADKAEQALAESRASNARYQRAIRRLIQATDIGAKQALGVCQICRQPSAVHAKNRQCARNRARDALAATATHAEPAPDAGARCEDCGGAIMGTDVEVVAQSHSLLLCAGCIESMEDEAEAYDQPADARPDRSE